ncbi:MAG TPA: heavy-metal-associated domain-containing protein [Deltaproteobacteria bacterium]|nr:heavy-metal-associated domain-containing protein [Deltaproteobacteria bacterium]HPJ95057.1 heavy-metal-associated domain-containing protein [Deltaproteobacteria bacterium]HPR53052.1 heavy-metal-associated domain-containing protein [Deltaproteobacteria bacterium]
MNIRTLKIQGMSCGHCVKALKKELDKIDGLTVHSVEIGSAKVSWNGKEIDETVLAAAVNEAGFRLLN